jgi:hypothetical protein
MGMRRQPSVIVRACAVAGLAVVMSSVSPTPVGLAQSAPPLTPWRGFIDHVSATYTGGVPETGVEVTGHAISGDGRFVVMQSLSPDLVPNDFNWTPDIFLRDRQTGTMIRLTLAEDGSDPNGYSEQAAISTNGRHVVFASSAGNLVAGDTNGTTDIFVRDLEGAQTVRVSVATDGTQSDDFSYWPAISATGRFVAFISQSTTLVPGPAPYGPMQVYLHDRDADGNGTFDEPGGIVTTLESVSSSGAMADYFTQHARISSDGRFVLFESSATNLDPVGNPNQSNHVYVRDRQAGTTTLIDRAITGGPSSWGTDYRSADMTDDGRFITYTTYSQDIVPFDMNWNSQVLRYDSQAQGLQTSIVTVLPDGTVGNGYSFDSSISADGRYVAFRSTSTNLAAPAQLENSAGVFVRDMVEGTFTRVDVLSSGEGFDHSFPYAPSISADGTAVAFMSPAMNAVDGQYTFGSQHTFVATGFNVSATSASFPMEGGTGSIDVNTLPVSGWNAVSLDPWIMLMEGAGFAAGPRTVTYFVDSNGSGIVRHGRITLGSTIVAIHQDGDGDTTPPVITPIVTGTLSPSGWYTSNITVQWTVTDPESEIVSTGYGCVTSAFTSDFVYASPTCEATSHGGTTSVTVPLRRDTTPPSITINSPAPVFYPTGAAISPAFGCDDPYGYSGVARCERTGGSGPIDNTTPGWHPFTVTATDQAGNTTSKTVEYLIGTGACVAQFPTLKAWWRFNGSMFDTVEQLYAGPSYASGWFDNAVAGQGWFSAASQNYLIPGDESRLLMSSALTVAMWVKPIGFSGQSGTLVTKPAQYRIARFPDGTLRWAFSRTTGYDWVNTGAVIPYQYWSHVALTHDNGLVNSYINGRLVHTQQLTGNAALTGDPNASLTIAGRADLLATLIGTYDDVQIYDGAMGPADVEALAQAGSGSLCVPNGSTLTVSLPATIAYGATFRVTAVLRDDAGNPIPNRQVWLNSHVAPGGFAGGVSGTTDAAGEAYADLPVSSAAALGQYARAASAVFEGDVVYRESSAQASATLVGGTPAVSWPSPTSIVYGTTLGAAQLNATATLQGSFSYSPAAGTVLNAGTHTLSVTFTPNDSSHWASATKTTTFTVDKAAPVVTVTGGTFTYDAQPHSASGTATGVLGEVLTPVQLLYNGTSETPPVDAGTHTVSASFTGSGNYTPAQSAAVPLVIDKATPIMSLAAETVTYDGQPHSASAAAVGVNNESLTPVVITYNGSTAMPVSAGTYAVEARYDGSTNYNALVRSATLTIVKAVPHLEWSSGPGSIVYGTPLGSAQFGATANVSGTFSYSPAAGTVLNTGTHTLTATFTPADGANYTGSSTTRVLTVVKAPLTITANSAAKPFGAPIPPFSITPAGFVNGDSMGSLAGALTFSTPATSSSPVGTYPIVPQGLSSPNYNIAFVTGALTVVKADTAVAITASPNPSGLNQPVIYTAAVMVVAPGAGAPGGVVQFFDGGTLVGTATLVAGSASLTTNGLAAGSHSISATYSGDASFAASSATTALTVRPSSTSSTTTLSSTRNPANVGQSVTFRATVSAPSGGTGGTVEFYDGSVLLGTGVVSSGVAQFTTTSLPAGGHAIVARYLGNSSLPPSASTALAQTIGSQSKSSSTAVSISPSPSALGNEVTITATVTGGQQKAPTGDVLFMVNGQVLAEVPVVVTGNITAQAVLTTSALPRGTHAIVVVYLADPTFRASARSTTLAVN